MEQVEAKHFFDLSEFEHSQLFLDREPVWSALGRIDKYLKTNVLGKIEVDVPRGTFLEQPELISIGKGTVIEPGAYIKGPCIIGNNCTIRHGAYIRGNVITGNKCIIGHDTEIKNSILLNGAQAAHFAYLGDSILGNRVNLGAGTKCANLKLNHENIFIIIEGVKFDTGRHKLGAIIGDDTQIGCNAVSNPGTLIGKKVSCHPCINFGVNFTYINNRRFDENPFTQRFRWEFELNPHLKLSKNTELRLRNRYEFLKDEYEPQWYQIFRQRQQLIMKVDYRSLRSITASNEFFYNLTLKKWDQIRLIPLELNFKVGKDHTYKLFVMIRWLRPNESWDPQFVLGSTIDW